MKIVITALCRVVYIRQLLIMDTHTKNNVRSSYTCVSVMDKRLAGTKKNIS